MMSLSRLASRSLSRDLETSVLVIVFLRMSGTGNGSCLMGSGLFVFSLAERRAVCYRAGSWCVQVRLSSVCAIVVSGS